MGLGFTPKGDRGARKKLGGCNTQLKFSAWDNVTVKRSFTMGMSKDNESWRGTQEEAGARVLQLKGVQKNNEEKSRARVCTPQVRPKDPSESRRVGSRYVARGPARR